MGSKKVLITGATGAIGKHLVKALVENGNQCRCLVRKSSNVELLKDLGCELFYGDICDVNSLKNIAMGIDVVYHLAAEGHISSVSEEACRRFIKINVEGTKNLANECIKSGIEKFVHFSSTAAMGLIEDVEVDEETPCVPKSPYQKSKYESEQTVLKLWREKGLPAIVLRPCMVYGDGCKGEYIRIFKYMQKGIFPRFGSKESLTPIIYVDNLVHAGMGALGSGEPGNVYLLVDQSIAIESLRKKVLGILGIRRPAIYVSPKVALFLAGVYEWSSKALRMEPKITAKNIKSTIADRRFNTSKAQRELGFSQVVGLDESLQKTIEWAKAEKYL